MDLKKILPKDGPPIDEVKKYIEKYKNESHRNKIWWKCFYRQKFL